MNKYTAAGLSAAATDGKRVVVLTVTQREARAAMDEFTPHEAAHMRVVRANGAERIDYVSGGSIRFHSHRANLRGMTADVVFIDAGVDERAPHLIDEVRPILATTAGEIIRA